MLVVDTYNELINEALHLVNEKNIIGGLKKFIN